MVFEELIEKLAGPTEAERPDIVSGLRATWGRRPGTLDGHWASELEAMILAFLSRFLDPEKIEAYNELADAEDLSRLGADDEDVDFMIYQSFINPVIDRLLETDPPNILSQSKKGEAMAEKYDTSWDGVNVDEDAFDRKYEEWRSRDWIKWLTERLVFPFEIERVEDMEGNPFDSETGPFSVGRRMQAMGLDEEGRGL